MNLLWNIHTELHLLLFPADDSIEDKLPHLRLHAAGKVRPWECVAVLLCDVTEVTAPGDERNFLRFLFHFLKRLAMSQEMHRKTFCVNLQLCSWAQCSCGTPPPQIHGIFAPMFR